MKKLFMILLMAAALILASACLAKPATPEPDFEPPQSESAPKKPTASEAAKHNAAISPESIRLIQFDEPGPGDEAAVIVTTEGEIRVRLFREQAPETVSAFVRLAKEGRYDDSEFAEAVDGYKIDGAGDTEDIVFPEEEFSLDLWNFRGAVAVSNNGSNFMIVTASRCLTPQPELEEINFPKSVIEKYLEVGGAPHQDWKNTVFGQVAEGMEVADRIAAAGNGEKIAITEIRIESGVNG